MKLKKMIETNQGAIVILFIDGDNDEIFNGDMLKIPYVYGDYKVISWWVHKESVKVFITIEE